jgi:hypothetical protein
MPRTRIDRRLLLTGGAALVPAVAQDRSSESDRLRPGEFAWPPERAPAGPVAVIVSLPQQAGPCLSQRRPHRRLHLLHRQGRPFDPDRHVRDPAKTNSRPTMTRPCRRQVRKGAGRSRRPLVVTDAPLAPDARSGKDFVILTS